ncbi:MAG: YceI family protein [Bacteroidetes bacterium]|nr:YceI family protein [Bacteroidota bacterium]
MKKPFQLLITISIFFVALGQGQAQTLTANTEQSNIRWYGEELTGKTHFGSLKFESAMVDVQDGIVTGGTFTVDMNSLNVEDLSGGGKARLEGHLKSDDFFSVEKHNKAELKITQKGKASGNTQTLFGELTIKGIQHPVEFTMTIGDNNTATAELTFDRSKYNVRFRSGSFFENLGDKLILDDIRMEVSLQWN